MTPAIFINCKEVPFLDMIFSIDKILETRSSNVLGKFSGMRVLLVETGNGAPMIRGSVTFGMSSPVRNRLRWNCMRNETRVPIGSRYDWKDDTQVKWVTPLIRPVAYDPIPLPADSLRHGRTWAEYTGELDFTPDFKGFNKEDD